MLLRFHMPLLEGILAYRKGDGTTSISKLLSALADAPQGTAADLLKRAIPNIGADVVARARKIAEKMDSAPPSRWGEYNWKLHEELYAPANRPITLEFVRKIHDNLDRYVRIQLSLAEENRQRAHQEHIKLINLCEAADRAKALKLLSGHINGVRDDLIDHLKRHPPE